MSSPIPSIPTEGLKFTQKFSRQGAGFLYDMRSLLPVGVSKAVDTLWNNRKKGSIHCEQTVIYKLSKSAIGALGFGRLYGSAGALERMEKECRGVLCKEFYHDIDIVNCHPVILVQYARNKYEIDLPELEKYISNREYYLSMISPNRDDAKTEIIKILYGAKNTIDALEPMANEVREFTKMLSRKDEYIELFNACKVHKETKETEKKMVTGIYGAFLSAILQTEERHCMLSMTEALINNKWQVDVLCYDGVMVRIREDAAIDNVLIVCEEAIKTCLGYSLKIIVKPFMTFKEFESYKNNTEMYKDVPLTKYLDMKREFETKNFYFAPTDEYYECEIGKPPLMMSTKHASAYYSTKWVFRKSERLDDYVSFFGLWMADPTRRVIKKLSLGPSTDPEVFTIPIQFQYQKKDYETVDVKAFIELVSILCFHKAPLIDYTLNWLAHLLQKPFDLPGVGIIFTGSKGVGKDTLIDFFMKYVIGSLYSTNYIDTKIFFEKHECGLLNKFMIKLEEADTKICLENASTLKGRLTSETIIFNPKNSKSITADNFTRFIMTTNGNCPVETSNGERRFVVIACSPEKKGDSEFWNTIRTTMFNDSYGYSVAKMLLERDISDFDVRKLPENEYQDAIIESRKTSEDIFMENWDGAVCSASELFEKYLEYCKNNDLQSINDLRTFGKSLLKYLRMNLKTKRTNKGVVYWQ